MYAKALVTGGAGFIGSHLVDALLARGVDVLVIDDLSTGARKNVSTRATFKKCSILAPAFQKIVRSFKPDAVFHLAARASVADSVARPVENAEANILGTIRVAEAAVAARAKRLVFSSTGGALYATGEPPFAESDPTEPRSPYGISKLAAEQYLAFFSAERGLSCASLRYANVYGPRQSSGGEGAVVPAFVQRLLTGKAVSVHGTGEQTRDFVYVDDVVAANLRAAASETSGPFNIGSGASISVNALLRALEQATAIKAKIKRAAARPGDVTRSVLNADQAKSSLGWEPTIALEDGLRRTVEWYREQQ